jgi:uncharacterized membrane protein YgcG
MTPEVQAYIDAKFTVNFYNQWAMIGALVGILVSKILIWRHLVWLVREQVSTHLEQPEGGGGAPAGGGDRGGGGGECGGRGPPPPASPTPAGVNGRQA